MPILTFKTRHTEAEMGVVAKDVDTGSRRLGRHPLSSPGASKHLEWMMSALRATRLAVVAACIAISGCDAPQFPRDPNHTLEKVLSSGRMTVVAVNNPPWAIAVDGKPASGAETVLIKDFASRLRVDITWKWMPTFEALEALEHGDADLAIGGFGKKDITAQGNAAASYGYFTERIVIAARPGAAIPDGIEGLPVFVPQELAVHELVREKGGLPVDEPGSAELVAIADWRAAAQGLRPTGTVLKRETKVVAVPKGENAWLMQIETFLRRESGGMLTILRKVAP